MKKTKEVNVPVKTNREIIIMVGYPGSGKSTIAKSMFEQHGYSRIDGDVFKTPALMTKEASKYIETQSIVFDATNGTKDRRSNFIDFAKKHNLPVRCVWKTTSIDQAMEQNRERFKNGGIKVPDVVYYVYRKKFQEPSADECELITVE